MKEIGHGLRGHFQHAGAQPVEELFDRVRNPGKLLNPDWPHEFSLAVHVNGDILGNLPRKNTISLREATSLLEKKVSIVDFLYLRHSLTFVVFYRGCNIQKLAINKSQ